MNNELFWNGPKLYDSPGNNPPATDWKYSGAAGVENALTGLTVPALTGFVVGGARVVANAALSVAGARLVTIVERLKRGDDLAAEIVNQHARERSQYEQLVGRGGPEPDEVLDVPEAVIRRRTEPKKLRIWFRKLPSRIVDNASFISARRAATSGGICRRPA